MAHSPLGIIPESPLKFTIMDQEDLSAAQFLQLDTSPLYTRTTSPGPHSFYQGQTMPPTASLLLSATPGVPLTSLQTQTQPPPPPPDTINSDIRQSLAALWSAMRSLPTRLDMENLVARIENTHKQELAETREQIAQVTTRVTTLEQQQTSLADLETRVAALETAPPLPHHNQTTRVKLPP